MTSLSGHCQNFPEGSVWETARTKTQISTERWKFPTYIVGTTARRGHRVKRICFIGGKV